MNNAEPDGGAYRVVITPQTGQAFAVPQGATVTVVDLEGHQVGDLWALDRVDPRRWLSTSHTRDRRERLFPRIGEQFTDQCGEAIMELVADTSPGVHDMLFPACGPALYASVGLPGHPNCQDNFLHAVAAVGLSVPAVPDPVNLFQNSLPQPDGSLRVGVAASRAGDAITLRAVRDLWLVLTSCSIDNWPTNNLCCTPLEVRILPADGGSGATVADRSGQGD